MSPSILTLFLRYYVQCHCILPFMFIPVYTCLYTSKSSRSFTKHFTPSVFMRETTKTIKGSHDSV